MIKQYQPKYNALLKDDKTYIALKINNRHPWPMVSLIRYRGKPKADGLYFGPYTSAFAARQTLDLIQRIFPLRQCSDQELLRRTRPCILYDMKRCIAPCVNKCTKEEYDHFVDGSIKFLKGQDKEVLKDLQAELEKDVEALEFEKAAEIFQIIRQIEKTIEGQKVDKPLGEDAASRYRQGDEVVLCQLIFRSGKLVGSRQHSFSRIAQDDHELLEFFCYKITTNKQSCHTKYYFQRAFLMLKRLRKSYPLIESERLIFFRPTKGRKISPGPNGYSECRILFPTKKRSSSFMRKNIVGNGREVSFKSLP